MIRYLCDLCAVEVECFHETNGNNGLTIAPGKDHRTVDLHGSTEDAKVILCAGCYGSLRSALNTYTG